LTLFTGMAFLTGRDVRDHTATAATLGRTHHVTINSAAQAAESLRPVSRVSSVRRFSRSVSIGSGMLAIPVLAGAGSAAMAGLIGHGTGFSNSLREAPVSTDCAPSGRSAAWRSACSA